MKGKKSDPEFVSSFIQESINKGFCNSNEIVDRARKLISKIDEDIIIAENGKKIRSKLLDVINTFDSLKKSKSEESDYLQFFDLKYPNICKMICDMIKSSSNTLKMQYMGKDIYEYNFSIKQLLEAKILSGNKDNLICGERFNEYIKYFERKC